MKKDEGFKGDPTRQADILKELLGLIEAIRYKRYDKWHDKRHPKGHRFTQLELKQVALPTYGNLLAGNSKRLPARQQILDVANYLECTFAETNDLLRCARYLPEREVLTEQGYRNLLDRAILLTQLVPLPAAVFKPDVEVVYATKSILKINGLPSLEKLSHQERFGGNWYLDASMPSSVFYTSTRAMTEANARGMADLMWLSSQHHRHEPWFKETLHRYMQLPAFQQQWDTLASEGLSLRDEDYGGTVMQTPFLDTPILEAILLLPLNEYSDLMLMFGIPKNEAAFHVYRQVGCRLDDVRWETLLHDMSADNG